jgi:hypothetical protein
MDDFFKDVLEAFDDIKAERTDLKANTIASLLLVAKLGEVIAQSDRLYSMFWDYKSLADQLDNKEAKK